MDGEIESYKIEEDDRPIEKTENRGTGPPYELVIPKSKGIDPAADDTHRIIALLDDNNYAVLKEYESDHIVVYNIQPLASED